MIAYLLEILLKFAIIVRRARVAQLQANYVWAVEHREYGYAQYLLLKIKQIEGREAAYGRRTAGTTAPAPHRVKAEGQSPWTQAPHARQTEGRAARSLSSGAPFPEANPPSQD